MAKINVDFNSKTYSVDESSLSDATSNLRTHLSTTMNGSGATINFGGTTYNVDSTKLLTATNDFIAHLGTVAGSGYKVVVNGVEYGVDSTKMADAVAELGSVFSDLVEQSAESGGDNLITFTIDGTTYKAEEGMTWGEWVESEYNTGGYIADAGLIIASDGSHNVAGNGTGSVYLSENIQPGVKYLLPFYSMSSGGAN